MAIPLAVNMYQLTAFKHTPWALRAVMPDFAEHQV